MEFTVTKRDRPKEHGSEGSEKVGVGCVRCAAAKARGEQRAGQRSADGRDDEAEDLDAIDADARETSSNGVPAYSLNLLADRCPLDQDPEAHDDNRAGDRRMELFRPPPAEARVTPTWAGFVRRSSSTCCEARRPAPIQGSGQPSP